MSASNRQRDDRHRRQARWALALSALLGLVVAGGDAQAQTAGTHPAELLELLSYLDLVPDVDTLQAAGAGQDGAGLVAVAADPSMRRYTRVRAVSFLAYFRNPQTTAFLETLARDRAEDVEVRLAALFTLSTDHRPERAAALSTLLRELLTEPNEEIWAGVARAAGRQPPEQCLALLDAFSDEMLAQSSLVAVTVERTREQALQSLASEPTH